jgi:hypothetical protein
MIQISVKADISAALAKLERIKQDVCDKAVVRAINKTASQVKVQASREIRDAGYRIKVAKIKSAISLRRANRTEIAATLKANGRPIGLINYGARQTKAGVSVQVKSGRKIIKGAFIATMPNGHQGVFVRKGPKHQKTQKNGKTVWSGLPIDELYGPSIPCAFMNALVQAALKQAVRDKFPRLLDHEIAYLGLKR